MSSTVAVPPAVVRAENISLLFLLHSVPSLPSSNPHDNIRHHEEAYTLPLSVERSLVGMLAFLSNTKNDINHVTALCLKENPQSSSLDVLLAINRLSSAEGDQVIEALGQGFEEIFDILSNVSGECDAPRIEGELFSTIVSICSERILGRLRLVADKQKILRPTITKILQRAVDSLKQLDDEEMGPHRPLSTLFMRKAEHVMKLADTWSKYQESAPLRDLVEGIYDLRQVGDIENLLDAIPNRIVGPNSRKNLHNTISKVARYREAARFLVSTAKRYRLVRRMGIILVKLPERAFDRYTAPAKGYGSQLTSTITRINKEDRTSDTELICRLLGISIQQAQDNFTNQVKRTLKKAKIHAEIQLLYYCDLNFSMLSPRVVCSIKDACFLCNLFVLMHGKMHISRYHGRLYPAWRLPLIPQFNILERNFNLVLEDRIRDSVGLLLSSGQKTRYPDPNESTLLTLMALSRSVSTMSSLTPAIEQTGDNEEELNDHLMSTTALEDDRPIPSDIAVLAASSKSVRSGSVIMDTKASCKEAELKSPLSKCLTSQPPPVDSCGPQKYCKQSIGVDWELEQGVPFSRVAVNHDSSTYTAKSLRMHVEKAAESSSPMAGIQSQEVRHTIEWLIAEEAEKLQKRRPLSIINPEELQGETTYEVDDEGCIFVAARGTVVKMVLYPKPN